MNRVPRSPREGSVAFRVIEYLQKQAPGTSITAREVADEFGPRVDSVATILRNAVKTDHLAVDTTARRFAWRLGPAITGVIEFTRQRPPATDDVAVGDHEGPLSLAHYSDGDLVVSGMQIDGDKAQFTRTQLQQLVAFATRPPVVLPPDAATTWTQPA